MTRTIAYNSSTQTWQVIGPEDEIEGNWNVVTQYWSTSLKCWVCIPE